MKNWFDLQEENIKKRRYIKIKKNMVKLNEAEKILAQQRKHLVVSMLWLKSLQLIKRGTPRSISYYYQLKQCGNLARKARGNAAGKENKGKDNRHMCRTSGCQTQL